MSFGSLVINAGEIPAKVAVGDSIAVNGVCLTATGFDSRSFSVDVMQETLRRSNLGKLVTGSRVNLELPLTLGNFVGGHLVQGHVDDTGKLISIRQEGDARILSHSTTHSRNISPWRMPASRAQ